MIGDECFNYSGIGNTNDGRVAKRAKNKMLFFGIPPEGFGEKVR